MITITGLNKNKNSDEQVESLQKILDLALKVLTDATSKFFITAGKKRGSALSSNLSRAVSEEVQFVGFKSKQK